MGCASKSLHLVRSDSGSESGPGSGSGVALKAGWNRSQLSIQAKDEHINNSVVHTADQWPESHAGACQAWHQTAMKSHAGACHAGACHAAGVAPVWPRYVTRVHARQADPQRVAIMALELPRPATRRNDRPHSAVIGHRHPDAR